MANLLFTLPDWFTPWGWVAIGAVVVVLLIVIIVCIAKSGKKSGKDEAGEELYSAPAEQDSYKEDKASVVAEEPAKEEPVKEEPAPAVKAEEKPVAETQAKPAAKAEAKPAAKPAAKAEAKPAAKPAAKAEEPAQPADAKTEEKPVAKPANKTYHISKRKDDNKWQVKAAGGAKALKLFNTQAEAIDYAKALAKSQEARIVIHKEDGSFRKVTY